MLLSAGTKAACRIVAQAVGVSFSAF